MSMFLQRHVIPQPDWKVLHFAPDKQLAPYFTSVCDAGYDPVDLHPKNYADIIQRPVRRFDLCKEAASLQPETYDLVLHSHVMEHIPCNVTLVMQYLYRAVKPGGVHLFAIPVLPGSSREDFDPKLTEEDRIRVFGHKQHIRRFGRDDFDMTFGPILGLTSDYTLTDFFTREELRRANIPDAHWVCSGSSAFMVRKEK